MIMGFITSYKIFHILNSSEISGTALSRVILCMGGLLIMPYFKRNERGIICYQADIHTLKFSFVLEFRKQVHAILTMSSI